jgi:hypothetical protein
MQTNLLRRCIETNHSVNNEGSLLAGDFSSAIASKLASYNCIVPASAKFGPDLPSRLGQSSPVRGPRPADSQDQVPRSRQFDDSSGGDYGFTP